MSEAKKEKAPRQLQSPGRIHPHGHVFNEYTIMAEEGTTIEDVCREEFWAHFSTKFRPYDILTVFTDDGMFYARLLVISAHRAWLNVKLIEHVPLVTADVEKTQSANFEIMFRGPRKWSIVHKSTKDVVRENIDNRDEAVKVLAAMDRA